MKAYTKFLSIFLAITMIASFTGCGNEPADAENDSLNVENNIEVAVGETTKIELSNENVVFSSDNEAVARVDENGEVTAVSDGEAVITAKIGDKEQTFTVKVSGKSAEALEKELEETKKQLEEALKENSELKDGASEEKDASKENTKETESKAEKPKTESKESKSAAAEPVNEKKTEKTESKPTNEKKTQQTTSKTETPKTEPAKKKHIPAANATTEGLPDHLHWLVASDMPWSNQGLIDDGVVPATFDLELARQEYKAGKGPYIRSPYIDGNSSNNSETDSNSSETEIVSGSREELEKVISLVNDKRENEGLEPVKIDEEMMEMAAIRATELTEKYSHTRPNGTSCGTIYDDYGTNIKPTGENIAEGYGKALSVFQAWWASNGHKENMMNPESTVIGVGRANNSWAMLLGK